MSIASSSPHTPRPRVFSLDVPKLVSPTIGVGDACHRFVQKLVAMDEIDHVALYVRPSLLGETKGRFILAASAPAGFPESEVIEADHPMSEWADANRTFSWHISDPSYDTGPHDRFHGKGLNVQFSLEGDLVLKLHATDYVVSAPAEIRGVQRMLVDLLDHFRSVEREVGTIMPLQEHASIDLAFLEATAMGDQEFIRHIVSISIEEMEASFQRLRAAQAADNRETLVFVAHKLRSTARTVGAEGLDSALEVAEQNLMTAGPEETDRIVARCTAVADDVLEALRSLI